MTPCGIQSLYQLPQAIAFSSSPPSPAVYGGSYTPAATGGESGNQVTFSIDSASTPGACTISNGTVSYTGTGSCVIDASQAAGNGYTAAPQQQAIAIGKAALTVTANNASRLFGAASPALAATITGYVNGDTSSVVAGSPDCTTTAQAWSPGGTYPVTCTQGTLSAGADYAFTFDPGTLTVGYTGGPCQAGSHSGPLTIASGQAACLGAGFTQNGTVTVQAGGALDIEGGTVTGPVNSTGAAQLRACGAAITGPVTVTSSTGLVVIGDDEAPACAANTITGPASLAANSAGSSSTTTPSTAR